jgi:DNA-binding CsgD family transcriptional regulator
MFDLGKRTHRVRPLLHYLRQPVANLVAAGLSNPEIARELFISRYAVQTHLTHVYAKLGLRSRAELTAAVLGRTAITTPDFVSSR